MEKTKLKVTATLIISFMIMLFIIPFNISAEQVSGFDYTNYYQLQYLQTDGEACIDLGNTYYTGFNYFIKINLSYSGVIPDTYKTIFGFYDTSSNGAPWSLWVKDTAVIKDYVTNETQSFTNNNSVSHVEFYRTGQSTSTNEHLYLFRANTTSNNVYKGINGLRIYYAEFKANNTIKTLYPAERKSDGVLGMYDSNNQVFYTNIGDSGSQFTGGPRINVIQYTITTDVSPNASGTVTGGGIYDANDVVTLTAVPNQGYTFSQWSDGSTNNPLTIAATSDITYIAYFNSISPPSNTYTVTTNVSPSGSGSVTGGGTYNENANVTLTAIANNGYEFSQWNDGNTSNPRTITVTGDLTYTATFTSVAPTYYQVTTSVSPSGSGSVTGGGSYISGSNITLTASPNNGYVFSQWSDGNADNPRNVVVTGNNTFTALFVDSSIINNVLVGYNVNIIDTETMYVIQNYVGTATDTYNNGNYELSFRPIQTTNYDRLLQVDFILNNDYIGLAVINYYIDSVQYTRSIYFNGNHFLFTHNSSSNTTITNATVTFTSLVLNDKYQGTSESNASVGDMTDQRDEFDSSATELYTYENTFNTDMNNNLNTINTNFNIGNTFGSKFMYSATWVKNQFDNLTNSTPFGTVLSFSLLLGIAMLLIGKAL